MKISVELEMKVVASNIILRVEKLYHTQQGAHISLVSDCGHLKLKLQCFITIYMYIFCHFDINFYTFPNLINRTVQYFFLSKGAI